ncbi:hypothetical protein NDU88_002904 [Pleurodeles waltl]|uniref:Myb/SANT-like DNA-binding domain-containing protein n=1 Tax=Pleurodeles waltl TaxID=8319 RepID=A0AAV7NHQ1_PLEWA|nr:hypothetical protein NDU88_002904 [Pleurodeles waltl]
MPPSPHMSQRTVPMKDNSEHRVKQLRGEDLHCKCCCDLGLEETMARMSGERAPAFTSEELEKLVDGVLPQYTLLYGPPDQQVSTHQKKDIWRAIAKDVRTLGVYHRRSTHCRKRWEDIRRWSKKTAEAQLGMASQRGRGARRTMTPLMFRILAVVYPELVGHHSRHKGHHQAEEQWHRSRRELHTTWPWRATLWSLNSPLGRRARGAPQRGQELRPATRTRPLM